MPKTREHNQIGKIVLFLYPIPNSRMLPSDLNRKSGLVQKMAPKIREKMVTDIKTSFLYICYIKTHFLLYDYTFEELKWQSFTDLNGALRVISNLQWSKQIKISTLVLQYYNNWKYIPYPPSKHKWREDMLVRSLIQPSPHSDSNV